MVDRLRKIFVVFAIVAIAVMGLPVHQAKAATIGAGSLIKASGPAVYYYASNGKRYVFPNEKTYKTWYADFSTVMTITDAELAAIQIGGNIVYRAGTTLVKITTDPKVYAIGPKGVLHWITSETVALDLYGAAWNTIINDVPDAFFTNYTYGSDLTLAVHPDGALIKYAASSDIFVIEAGEKRLIADEASFIANMFMNENVVTVADTVTYTTAMTGLSVAETMYTDVAQLGGGTVIAGDLTVAVASTTPALFTAPLGGVGVEVAQFNFTAGSDPVALNGLVIKRTGLGLTTEISKLYLYNGATKLTSGRSINSSTHTATFTNLGVTVAANSTLTLTVKADLSSTSGGGSHFMTIDGVGDVNCDANVGGIYPVVANEFTVSSSVNVGKADVESNGQTYTRKVGESDVEVANFTVYVDNTENGQFESITLYNAGRDILSNLKVYRGSTLVATGSQSGDYWTFSLNTPYEIAKGDSAQFVVKGDISGRDGDSATLYVRYKTDVRVKGLTYGYSLDIDTTKGADGNSYVNEVDSTQQENVTTAEAGQITASFNGPVASDVARNTNDVVLMNFALTAQSDVEVERATINISGNAGLVAADVEELELVCNDLVVANWSTVTIGDNVSTDTWTLPVGGVNCVVRANITNSAAGDETILATLVDLAVGPGTNWSFKDSNTGDTITDIVPSGNIAGNTMTVTSASLAVNVASAPATGSVYVPRTVDGEMVAFLLTAGDASDVKMTNLTLNAFLDNNANGSFGDANEKNQLSGANDVVSAVKLFDEDGVQIGTTKSLTVNAGDITVTFDNFTFDVPAGTTKKILVKASISSTAPKGGTNDNVAFAIKSIVSEYGINGAALTATINGDNATPNVYQGVVGAGVLTASQHADTPTSALIAMDASSTVTKIKFAATREDIVVEKLAINYNGRDGVGEGSTVVVGDSDIASAALTQNTNLYGDLAVAYVAGDCVYDNTGGTALLVEAGDIRVTSCATYAAGSIVVLGDTDDAGVLFALNNVWGTGAAGWVAADFVYTDAGTTSAVIDAADVRVTAKTTVTSVAQDEFASSTISYTNSAGNMETKTAYFVDGLANFTSLDVLVPKDDSVAVDVIVNTNADTSADNYDAAASLASSFNLATTGFRSVTAISGAVVTTLSGSAAGNAMYVFNAYPSFVVDSTDGTLTQKLAFEIGTFTITANGNKDVTFVNGVSNIIDVEVYANGSDLTSNIWITDGSDILCNGGVPGGVAVPTDVTGGSNTLACDFNVKSLTIAQNSSKTLHVFMDTLTSTLGDNSGETVSIALEEGTTVNVGWSIDSGATTWTDIAGGTEITDILFRGNLVGGSYSAL